MLTKREKQVLVMFSNGYDRKDVGRMLGISLEGVKSHTRAIRKKLDAANTVEAVARALREGMIE